MKRIVLSALAIAAVLSLSSCVSVNKFKIVDAENEKFTRKPDNCMVFFFTDESDVVIANQDYRFFQQNDFPERFWGVDVYSLGGVVKYRKTQFTNDAKKFDLRDSQWKYVSNLFPYNHYSEFENLQYLWNFANESKWEVKHLGHARLYGMPRIEPVTFDTSGFIAFELPVSEMQKTFYFCGYNTIDFDLNEKPFWAIFFNSVGRSLRYFEYEHAISLSDAKVYYLVSSTGLVEISEADARARMKRTAYSTMWTDPSFAIKGSQDGIIVID